MGGKGLRVATAVLLLSVATNTAPVVAAPTVTPLNHLSALSGDYFPLQSRAVGHLYHIYTRLPEGYDASPKRRYPIVYLLDGDSAFPYLAPHHLFLTYDDDLPEAIVVGIAYGSFAKPMNRRHIDFMPPAAGVPEKESGAAAFQRFLKSELIPAVERRYRADPTRRILVGQSRGGAMVLYSAYSDPDLFWARIASNPAMMPGKEIWFGEAPKASRKDLRLILASGTQEEPDRRRASLEWYKYWEGRSDAPWFLKGIDIQGGTHAADLPNAYRAAMRWLFAK